MKVLLVNGSPHETGCTYTGLSEIAKTLNANGVETEIFWIGKQAISGCHGCGACRKLGKCYMDDIVNEFVEKAKDFDGYVFGTPVHYASAGGSIVSLLDRAFYSSSKVFSYKPASAIASCRRSGATASLDVLNKYFTINCMPVVSARYWNGIHGNTPEEVMQDEEGMQTMRIVGHNMAWLLKCIALGKEAGITPAMERKILTNFIK